MTQDVITQTVRNMQLRVSRQLSHGRYEFERVLAVGGQGVTLVARDMRLGGNRVLIKVPLHGNSFAKGSYTFNQEKAQRHNQILYEVVVVQDLNSLVQNVPRLIGYFEDENAQLIGSYPFGSETWSISSGSPEARDLFLVYEFLSAGAKSQAVTLEDLLERQGPLSERWALQMAHQIADVLAQLHRWAEDDEGKYFYIYQDLKPSNILVTGDRYFLIDFGGLVRSDVKPVVGGVGHTFDIRYRTGAVTFGYAPPEAFDPEQRAHLSNRFDIFCLGATLFHALSGIRPIALLPDPNNPESAPDFSDTNMKAKAPQYQPTRLVREIVSKATAFKPLERYKSIELMNNDILKALGED